MNNIISRLKLYRHIRSCLLCTKPEERLVESNNCVNTNNSNETKHVTKEKKKKDPSQKQILDVEKLFHEYPHLSNLKNLIPNDLLYYKTRNPKCIYLICPKVAKKVANYVLPTLNLTKKQVVAESNPGLGLIAQELVKCGVPEVRLYESCTEFHSVLPTNKQNEGNNFPLYNYDFFKLRNYTYIDNQDMGQRVSLLLQGVPHNSWTDDPAITVVGTLTDIKIIHYLIKSIILQTGICNYGRMEIFALTYGKYWHELCESKQFRAWKILFKIFFDIKLLDRFQRKLFLPWEQESSTQKLRMYDPDYIYLLQISMKKQGILSANEFLPFYCFMQNIVKRGTSYVIPVSEKWVPGCGVCIIEPKLKHEEYFEDMSIFTKFNELSANQIVGIFRELISRPEYHNSPFMDMVDREIMRTETISVDLYESLKQKTKARKKSE